MIRQRVVVNGDVQGVGFRYWTKVEADRRGLSGFVRNDDDGSVTVECQGDDAPVASLLEWLKDGPQWARVSGLDVERIDPRVAEPGLPNIDGSDFSIEQ